MSVSFSRLEEVTVRLSSYTVKLVHLSVIPSRPNLLNCATSFFVFFFFFFFFFFEI